jgi:hypothetical protein
METGVLGEVMDPVPSRVLVEQKPEAGRAITPLHDTMAETVLDLPLVLPAVIHIIVQVSLHSVVFKNPL